MASIYIPGMYAGPYMPRYWLAMAGLAFVPALDFRKIHEPVQWLFGSFLLWSGLTLLWTPSLYGGAFMLATLVLFALIAVASATMGKARRDLLFAGFGWGMGLSVVAAAAQKFFGFDYFPVSPGTLPAGLFYNAEPFAEATAPIFVWALLSRRWWLSAILAVGLVLTHEHAAVFAAIMGVTAIIISDWRVRSALFALIAAIGVLSLTTRPESADTRLLYWLAAIHSFTWAGGGLGWWFQAHPFPFEEYVHSDILQAIVEQGVMGVALPAAFLVALWKSPASRAERGCFVACGVLATISFTLHQPAALFLTAVAAGAVARREPYHRVALLPGRGAASDGARWPGAFDLGIYRGFGPRRFAVSIRSAFAQRAAVHPQTRAQSSGGG